MPEVSDVHVDSALTNVSVQYGRNEFLSNLLFPVVPVAKQSDKYFVLDEEREGLRQSDDRRAAGAEALEADFGASTDTYFCEDHALQAIVADEERANADPAIQADIDKVEFLSGKILLNKEIALASALSSGVSNSQTVSNKWDDYTNGDPVGDVSASIQKVIDAVQAVPNVLVIDYSVYLALKDHPDLVDRVQFQSGGEASVVTREALAQVFGLERVLIGRSFKNTAARGQTASVSAVWSDTAYVAYVPERPGLRRLALGYTFAWTNGGAATEGRMVEQWRNDARRGDQVRVSFYYDQKLVAAGAACKMADVLT
ncbi:hypothetical protein JXA32_03020 [Candidatus Sumerlaeota bacterium]|nr:hypothetical protein [Candidatus Sumerlaeota bacterium]